MSTTRHLINRRRRLAAAAATAPRIVRTAAPRTVRTPPTPDPAATTAAAQAPTTAAVRPGPSPARPRPAAPRLRVRPAAADRPGDTSEPAAPGARTRTRFRPLSGARISGARTVTTAATAALTLLTVLLGTFAAVAAQRASALHDAPAARNSALTDTAGTSRLKGAVTQAVNAVFSYDFADTARTDRAAARVLTGRAVGQYTAMIAQVRKESPSRKLVLTTTVTDTGVQMIDGDRARVLVFADQRNTSTAASAAANAGTTYAAAMFAVDAVRFHGVWKIAAIDTFGRA